MNEKHEVLVSINNPEAIAKVREIVKKINGGESTEYSNDLHVRFQYIGTMIDGIECMAAGASSVS
jgi:hypothetical protein